MSPAAPRESQDSGPAGRPDALPTGYERISTRLARVHPAVWPVLVVVTVAALSSQSTFATVLYLATLAGVVTALLTKIALEGVKHGPALAALSAVAIALVTLVVLLDRIGQPLLGKTP